MTLPSGMPKDQVGVVLVGHGQPASDCPPQLIGELMMLEWRANGHGAHGSHGGHGHGPSADPSAVERRVEELDATIRDWPRTAENDPYRVGFERLAEQVRPMLGTELFAIGYNEFCRPSTTDAVESLIARGARQLYVISVMMTPGGVHSERDIPRELELIRRKHPGVTIEYAWPFDLPHVAQFLAQHVRQWRGTDVGRGGSGPQTEGSRQG